MGTVAGTAEPKLQGEKKIPHSFICCSSSLKKLTMPSGQHLLIREASLGAGHPHCFSCLSICHGSHYKLSVYTGIFLLGEFGLTVGFCQWWFARELLDITGASLASPGP